MTRRKWHGYWMALLTGTLSFWRAGSCCVFCVVVLWPLGLNCLCVVVNSRVVKQTVMTSVYGVTFTGARLQIQSKLKEKFDEMDMNDDERDALLYRASSYLARVVLGSIGELFKSADAIKEWLATCAKMVGDRSCANCEERGDERVHVVV